MSAPVSPNIVRCRKAALRIGRRAALLCRPFFARPPPQSLDQLWQRPLVAKRTLAIKTQTSKAYYPGSAYGGLRRFRQQITYRDLAGRPPFFRFDPIRLRANYDRRKSIEPIGALNAARAPNGDERTFMAASEDDIRGLRRFGESRQPLSDLVDADAVSRHLGITPRRVLSMARKGSIPCVRISAKTIRFDIEAVDRALGRR